MTSLHGSDPFYILRKAQVRSAETQQIFSGRDWLRASTFVQFLSAIYPIYLWMSFELLHYREASFAPTVTILRMTALAILVVGFLFLILSWWAKYAPFRAASVALGFYLVLNVFFALTRPEFFMDGIVARMIVFLGLIMAVRTGFYRHKSR